MLDFYKTRGGHQFIDGTMKTIAGSLKTLVDNEKDEIQVKLIEGNDIDYLESQINEFVSGKKNVKVQIAPYNGIVGGGQITAYLATIAYKEVK